MSVTVTLKKSSQDILITLLQMAKRGELHGCFADIPAEVYHHPSCPGVSSTQIKAILKKSYLHYLMERDSRTKPLYFGTAFHSWVNEPDDFVHTYEIAYNDSHFLANPNMVQLKSDDFELIKVMSKKLFEHPIANEIYSGAQHELTYFALDQETGILKKCRVDAIKGEDISDLKTCESAAEEDFARDCRKYLYRVSAAFYLEVVSEAINKYMKNFYLIACEKKAPNEIGVYRVSDISIARAEQEIREALRTIKRIQTEGSNAWKGLPLQIKDLAI